MPYLKLETNVAIPEDTLERVLHQLSAAMAEGTGKPETVVQVAVQGGVAMLMRQTMDANAHVHVAGINLLEENADKLALSICAVLDQSLGIREDRVFINFVNFPGAMWGVGSKTRKG